MPTPEEQRREEAASIERASIAFERFQKAFLKVNHQLRPNGNGQPSQESLDELNEAEAKWRGAEAEMSRITAEIRSGKRR